DYDMLIPASVEALAEERHAAARARYEAEAARWREAYIAEFGIKPPETLRPGTPWPPPEDEAGDEPAEFGAEPVADPVAEPPRASRPPGA
ncbi:MAG TPA: hypothetical protein VFK35_05150, partial [Candidatus Limnocylindrales bacterium]|nr:hypothetical protein [Candidatus Limnocylindrales bacterium]